MSLLDDVSIVVTPNGYKAGELYAVIPVPTEGAEEVTDGNFPLPNTEWSSFGLATINENIVNFVDAGSNTYSGITQDINSFSAKRYKVEITVTNWISGDILATFSSNTESFNITGNGTYSVYLSPVNNGDDIGLVRNYSSGANFSYSITSVSVKEYTSADMDVTRATAATRVDENGLVNYAEVIGGEEVTNGDFATDSDWTLTQTTIAGNKATVNSTTAYSIKLTQSLTTIELGKKYRILFTIADAGATINFKIGFGDLSNGTYSDVITAAGTYEIDLIQTDASAPSQIALLTWATAVQTFSITNISVKEVTRDNVPRIDYTGGGCPHILAEPQRTNTVTYSEDFSQYSYGGTAPTLTTGQLAPDGTYNATKVSGVIGSTSLYKNSESSTTASRSIYARTVSGTGTARLTSYNSNTNNLFTLTEEWQRFELTGSNSTGATNFYAADFRGSQTLSEFIIWGGQSEEGSYATSYIPTSGSTVTRNQDIFTRDGIGSLINSTEGVLFLEIAKFQNATNFGGLELNDTTNNNSITIYTRNDNSSVTVIVRKSGSQQCRFDFNTGVNTYDFNSYAIRFSSNNFSLWFNGNKVSEQLSGDTPLSLNNITLDAFQGGDFEGKVKQLQVYKTALTDTQLAALTS